MVAREFNFSETVFLDRKDASQPPRVRIFTPVTEINFAGHPVIGVGHVLFRHLLSGASGTAEVKKSPLSIPTQAGEVVIDYDPGSRAVVAEVPHNIHRHTRDTPKQSIADTQPGFTASKAYSSLKAAYPSLSIVKGVTYFLVDLTDLPELFADVKAGGSPAIDLDDEWGPSFTGTMYYRAIETRDENGTKVQSLRVRMIAINLEDPACGSGCCSLGAYLALQDGARGGKYRFQFDQGSEIGRDSALTVHVVLNELGSAVSKIQLSGEAVPVMEGTMLPPL